MDRKIFNSQNKCSKEDCELDHNTISYLLSFDVGTDNKSSKQEIEAPCISRASKSLSGKDCIEDVVKLFGSMTLSGEVKEGFNAGIDFAEESFANRSHFQSSKSTVGESKYDKSSITEAILTTSTVFSATEALCNEKSHGNEGLSMNKVEGKIMSHDQKDSIFPTEAPFSGSMVYSGQISHSGSISLRSNSSNSTHSFAFPILSAEWNGSPVRMGDSNKTHLKKQPRGRKWFFCCKF